MTMYKYVFPKSIISYINKKEKCYWLGRYDFFLNYFKIKNSPMFWTVFSTFNNNLNYTYYSKTKLNVVPFAGYLLNINLFEETKIS